MASKRDLIRWFIKEVHWATPQNVAYFMAGRSDSRLGRAYASELSEMLKVKDRALRLRRIRNQDGRFAYTMSAKALPTFLFNHNVIDKNFLFVAWSIFSGFLYVKKILATRYGMLYG